MGEELTTAKNAFERIAQHCYDSGVETLASTARFFTFETEAVEDPDTILEYIEELKAIADDMDIADKHEVELIYDELRSEIG